MDTRAVHGWWVLVENLKGDNATWRRAATGIRIRVKFTPGTE